MRLKLRRKDVAKLYELVEEKNLRGIQLFLSRKLGKKIKVWDAEIRDNEIIVYLGRSI